MSNLTLNSKLGLGLIIAAFVAFVGAGVAYQFWPGKSAPANVLAPAAKNPPAPAPLRRAALRPRLQILRPVKIRQDSSAAKPVRMKPLRQ